MSTTRRLRAACALLGASLAALSASAAADEALLTAEETAALVREVWYEGLPYSQAARIGPEGAALLAALLADPEESAHHANALLALGICGGPGAYEAIEAWAGTPREGELDRNTFRAWQTLPFARGHLARRDARALGALSAQLSGQAAPGWHFRNFRGERLAELSRRGAASGLAVSGLPQARSLLVRAQRRPAAPGRAQAGPGWDAHIEEALALHGRVAGEGAETVFAPAARGAVR